MEKELANYQANATQRIVKAGEDKLKQELLDSEIPEFAVHNHKTKAVHIHDLEFYSISHNCIGIRVQHLLGNKEYSVKQALRELGRKIIWLTNMQSGGIGFIDFDSDMAEYVNTDSDEEIIEELREFFFDLNVFSRKGCEKPYVTFNFGLNTTEAGRRFSRLLLKAYAEGDENGNPFIFPNLVFKLKELINIDEESPNHVLYIQALKVTSKRMVPTYFNCDAPGNKKVDPNNIGIMGCRTRVVSNLYGKETGIKRGNIACVTINLVQLAFQCSGNVNTFYDLLNKKMAESKEILLHRFTTLCEKGDFSALRRHNLYENSDKPIDEMLKSGTLSIGFIGLWDALSVLHNVEFNDAKDMSPYTEEALSIISKMREIVDGYKDECKLNFSLLASAAEGVSGSFAEYDSKHLGKDSFVCAKGYYTNSFHVPVFINADYIQKIDLEAPFHALCNGGCITYVEMAEMPGNNIEATKEVVDYAYKSGCNYIGINFPLDNCNDCGFIGRIMNTCPKCNSTNIRRLRRVSGYLAEENRFTAGKRKEMLLRKSNIDFS